MERFVTLRLDGEIKSMPRRVRAAWGALTPGAFAEVEIIVGGGTEWVRCQVDGWAGAELFQAGGQSRRRLLWAVPTLDTANNAAQLVSR